MQTKEALSLTERVLKKDLERGLDIFKRILEDPVLGPEINRFLELYQSDRAEANELLARSNRLIESMVGILSTKSGLPKEMAKTLLEKGQIISQTRNAYSLFLKNDRDNALRSLYAAAIRFDEVTNH